MARIQFRGGLEWVKETEESAAGRSQASEPARIAYHALKDGPLAAFDRSAKGAELKKQYRADIGKLRDFLQDRGHAVEGQTEALRNLDAFSDNIAQGVDGPYSTALHALYGPGKEALDNIAARLDCGGDAVEKLKSSIVEMALGLDACAPGAASRLMIANQQIILSQGGIGSYAGQVWDTLFDNALRHFVEAEHGGEENYQGEEIHLVNQYRNLLAQDFHVTPRLDDFVPPHVKERRRPERCKAFIEQHVTPAHLLRFMAEECLQTVQEHFHAYRDRPLDEAAVWEMHETYEQSLSGSLALKYGEIEPGTLVNEHHGEQAACAGEAGDAYRLIDNPTLLMRVIARNLFKARIFDKSYKPVRLGGEKGGARALKQIGEDGFYTRSGRAKMAGYRPLRVDELIELAGQMPEIGPDSPLFESLLRGALANTRSPESLSRLEPQYVWRAMLQDATPTSLIERLAQPAVRRYREANAGHDRFLMEHAAQVLVGHLSQSERQYLLHSGSLRGERALIIRIAESLDDISTVDEFGMSALHHAAQNGDGPLLAVLVKKGASIIDLLDDSDCTPLMLAASGGHIDAIDQLVKAGAEIDKGDGQGTTALMLAAWYGQPEAVDRLVAARANVNKIDQRRKTPLMMAAENGHAAAVDRLVAAHARVDAVDPSQKTALMMAAENDHAEVIDRLVQAGVEIDKADMIGLTALIIAARHNRAAAIDRLVAANADVDKADGYGMTALMLAAFHDQVDAIDRLLAANAKVDKTDRGGFTPLMMAAQNNSVAAIRRLGAANATIDAADMLENTALMMAAFQNKIGAIDALITAHADVDKANHEGVTALMLAVRNDHVEAIDRLAAAGATIDKTDDKSYTALMRAAFDGNARAIDRLVAANAVIDKTTDQGFSALMLAAANGHVEAVGRLVSADASVDQVRDSNGTTALMQAALNGHLGVVERLIAAGAEVRKKDHAGRTALQLARAGGHVAVVDRLRRN